LKEEKKYKRKYAHHLKLTIHDAVALTELYSQCLGSVIHLSSNMANMIHHDVSAQRDPTIERGECSEDTQCALNLFAKVHKFSDVLNAEKLENINQLIGVMESEYGIDIEQIQGNFSGQYQALVDQTKEIITKINSDFDKRMGKRTESLMNQQKDCMQSMDSFWRAQMDSAVEEKNEFYQTKLRQIKDKLVTLRATCTEWNGETVKNLKENQHLRAENMTLKGELDVKCSELETAKATMSQYRSMLKDVRGQLVQIREQHVRDEAVHDAEVMTVMRERMMFIASDIEAAEHIKSQAVVNKMQMEINMAVKELECTRSQTQEQEAKNQKVITKLMGNVEIYKIRNEDSKIKLKFLEKSMADLSKMYPRSQKRASLQSTLTNALEDNELLKEVSKLRQEVRRKNMELVEQRASHKALQQKLELTQEVHGGYKKELDMFIQKTNNFVKRELF